MKLLDNFIVFVWVDAEAAYAVARLVLVPQQMMLIPQQIMLIPQHAEAKAAYAPMTYFSS